MGKYSEYFDTDTEMEKMIEENTYLRNQIRELRRWNSIRGRAIEQYKKLLSAEKELTRQYREHINELVKKKSC